MTNNAAVSAERKRLDELFPDYLILNKKQVRLVLGGCCYDTLRKRNIPWDRYGKISKVALAKWLEK